MRTYSDEIEKLANIFLEGALQELFINAQLKLRSYSYTVEKGIDFNFEIEDRQEHPDTLAMFYLQNKGCTTQLKPLKSFKNKGKISFPIKKIRNIIYFCAQVQQPLILTVCDLTTKTIYWLPIQLESEEYLQKAEDILELKSTKRKGDSIQVYLDPAKTLVRNGNICHENLDGFIDDINKSKTLLSYRSMVSGKEDESMIPTINVDKNEPLLNQIYEYLRTVFQDVEVLPARFWANAYPFKTSHSDRNYQNKSTLFVGNQAIIDLFNDKTLLNAVDNKTRDKVHFITHKFCQNSISYLTSLAKNETVVIQHNLSQICDCIKCCYNRLELDHVLTKAEEIHDSESQNSKVALINYKFGFWGKAGLLLIKCLEQLPKHGQEVREFIYKLNLSQINKMLPFDGWEENLNENQVNSIRKQSLDLNLLILKHSNKIALKSWLHKAHFFRDIQHNILEAYNKLREYHHIQQFGGKSSNSYIWEIYAQFIHLDQMLNENIIFYERYAEYSNLIDILAESICISHSIDKINISRLSFVDDFLLRKLILEGNAETLLKLFRRYSINEIPYKRNDKYGQDLNSIIANFFNCQHALSENDFVTQEQGNFHFFEKYNQIFSNLLIVYSFIEQTEEQVQAFADKLIAYLRSAIVVNFRPSSKYIAVLLANKHKLFSDEQLLQFPDMLLNIGYLHDLEIIETLEMALNERKLNVLLSDTIFQKIKDVYFESCTLCQHHHDPSNLVYLAKIFQQNDDGNSIKQRLKELLEQNISWRLYYLATILDVIEFDQSEFETALSLIKLSKPFHRFGTQFTIVDEKRSFELNSLINLAYKNNVNLTHSMFDTFRGFDRYYDWLMDIEGFDYTLFDPTWLKVYFTKFYKMKMAAKPEILARTNDYLQAAASANDIQLKNIYISLTASRFR